MTGRRDGFTNNQTLGPPVPMTFEDREHGFEAKFAHDQELQFRALARRDKLFAVWTAGRIGLQGEGWTGLIHTLLTVQGFPHHDAALVQAAVVACAAAGAEAAPQEVHAALAGFAKQAEEQVLSGNTPPIDIAPPPAR